MLKLSDFFLFLPMVFWQMRIFIESWIKSAFSPKSPTFGHCHQTFGHRKPGATKPQALQARHRKPGTTKPQAEIGFSPGRLEKSQKPWQKRTENIAFSAFSGHIILKLAFCEDSLKKANSSRVNRPVGEGDRNCLRRVARPEPPTRNCLRRTTRPEPPATRGNPLSTLFSLSSPPHSRHR